MLWPLNILRNKLIALLETLRAEFFILSLGYYLHIIKLDLKFIH